MAIIQEYSKEECAAACDCTLCQQQCRCKSNVNLFYGVNHHGLWSIGTRYFAKDLRNEPAGLESENTQFLRRATSIPVPKIIAAWDEGEDCSMRITERIEGTSLDEAWNNLTTLQRRDIAKQVAAYVAQLRDLQSDTMHSLGETGKLYAYPLFPTGGPRSPVGPFNSDDQLWAEMAKSLKGLPDNISRKLHRSMPPAAPYTFSHGDLSMGHIMIKDGKVTGILDWEKGGYFPRWFEFASTFTSGKHVYDHEWKELLREYMEPDMKGAEFWVACQHLANYPDLGPLGQAFLKELKNKDADALSFSGKNSHKWSWF